jgi:phosphohistidine swiveling domain-containing protein
MSLGAKWLTDWEPSDRLPVYTRANAGEVLPDPASPLSWTFLWEPAILPGWADSMVEAGTFDEGVLDAVHPEVVGLFGGRLYINASCTRLFGERAPGLSAEMVDLTYFGEHPDVPPYVHEPWHDSPHNTELLGTWMGTVLTATELPQLLADRAGTDGLRDARPDLGALTDHQLVERARSFLPEIRRLFCRHIVVTAGSSIGPGVLAAVAQALDDPSLALTLITGIGDVDSAAPSQAMWELSRLPASSPEFTAGFAAFVRRFGSRGPTEWDLRSETWETQPSLALGLIEVMRPASDDEAPQLRNARNIERREAATAGVRTALADQPEVLAQFEAGLRSAHVFLAGRERTKTTIIKVVHEVRMALRELGARHGFTTSETCMLLADEVDAFVSDPDAFRPRLAAREQQFLELYQLDPPFIVDHVVPPLDRWARTGDTRAAVAAAGDVLHGVPGAPGKITGRARVVLDPADPFALEPGDVLVAPNTDPSWTPLFVPASAVVVNVGAQVSHAVIVSRELGIPCAVSVHGATERIPDGALVEVDGNAGTVTVISLS